MERSFRLERSSRYNFIFVMVLLTFVLCMSFQNAYSYMDMDELKSVYYGLDIVQEPVVIDENIPLGAVHVMSKYGQQYQCSFPDHTLEEKKKEEEEKLAIETGVIEMLRPMASKDCLFKTKDWWSYEFCYGKYVRQYHMEEGEIKGNIMYLGYFESDFDWNNETSKTERLKSSVNGYHSQSYTQGSSCDLTGKLRTSEVRFMCEENSEDYLARIDESQTCVYTMTVMTSRICRHPFFKSPVQRKSVPITCNPLLTQDEFDQFHEEQLERKMRIQDYENRVKRKASAEKADTLFGFDKELDQMLEREMSAQAKELLGGSLNELFPSPDKNNEVSKEKFEAMFGSNEKLWELYQKGLDIVKKSKESKAKEPGDEQKERGTEKEEDETKDEDDEIISGFQKEIDELKHKYHRSQNKVAGIKKKLIKGHNWESDIENAIKEAEQEFGMKVDRNLVSGLSDTLNKLVNKLEDTEAELNSMDEEINSLKPAGVTGRKGDVMSEKGAKEGTNVKTTPGSDTDGSAMGGAEDSKTADMESSVDQSSDAKTEMLKEKDDEKKDEEGESHKQSENIEDKIEAPPATGAPRTESSNEEQPTFPRPKDASEEEASQSGDEKPELKVKVSVTGDEETDKELSKLPGNIRKLLEDSVRKEYEKKSIKRGSEKLGLDDDHSFTRDKTVHVIQQEDEEGRTNRFIVVLGFNNFDDESTELQRQTSLEENYGFVYKGQRKGKKQETSTESKPDR